MKSETLAESVNVNCGNEPESSMPTEIDFDNDRVAKKAKKTKSEAWDNFTKIGLKDGKEKTKCNWCGQEYVMGGTKIGTSTLLRHQKVCKLKPKYHDVPGMMIDNAGRLRAREVDQKRIREVISMAIIEHGLPFNFVEYKWIRELHSMLNMDVKHICRNTAVLDIWKIECLLRENAMSDDMIIKDMAERMLSKFKKYWKDYSVILAIAAILDPKMKFNAIRFCYEKLDSSTCEEKISYLKAKMHLLYEDYVKERLNESSSASNSQSVATMQQVYELAGDQVGDAFADYVHYVSQNVSHTRRSELDLYLEEAVPDPKYHEKLDVLLYWKDRRERCPNLSRMACDVLSILITTVASESALALGLMC